jgi:hypothetical protein
MNGRDWYAGAGRGCVVMLVKIEKSPLQREMSRSKKSGRKGLKRAGDDGSAASYQGVVPGRRKGRGRQAGGKSAVAISVLASTHPGR